LAAATRCSPAAAGISANSAGAATSRPGAEQSDERKDRRERSREGERDRSERLACRGEREHARVLEPIDEQPGDTAERDDRAEQRDEERRHGEARAGAVGDLQRQRHEREKVPERGDPDRRNQQSHIAP